MIIYIIFIIVGLISIIFHHKLAKEAVRFQNEKYGFHFGDKVVGFNAVLNIVIGLLFVVVGALGLLHVLPPAS